MPQNKQWLTRIIRHRVTDSLPTNQQQVVEIPVHPGASHSTRKSNYREWLSLARNTGWHHHTSSEITRDDYHTLSPSLAITEKV